MKAILDTKPTSIYDDDLTRHYHFPRRYAALMEKCVGDWVVLRRPRADGGSLAYFATAKVSDIEPDLGSHRMSYARLTGYMDFDSTVPWRLNGRYAEEALRNIPIHTVGVYLRGRSVRLISDDDFIGIVATGLNDTFDPSVAEELGLPREPFEEVSDSIRQAGGDQHVEAVRHIERALSNRIVRDSNFRRSVSAAYEQRCAISGLRILDMKGRAEAQAAHVWPATEGGPDAVQNGIALCATVHWLFDRHLISLTDDCRILMREERIPAALRALMVEKGQQIRLPNDLKSRPHPRYIAIHRKAFCEQG